MQYDPAHWVQNTDKIPRGVMAWSRAVNSSTIMEQNVCRHSLWILDFGATKLSFVSTKQLPISVLKTTSLLCNGNILKIHTQEGSGTAVSRIAARNTPDLQPSRQNNEIILRVRSHNRDRQIKNQIRSREMRFGNLILEKVVPAAM
jgi:hypothetical protein